MGAQPARGADLPLIMKTRSARTVGSAAARLRVYAAAVAVSWLAAQPGLAAVPVEESQATASGAAASAPAGAVDSRAMNSQEASGAGAPAAESGRLTELFYQLQVLQQEVQDLRGTIEEQQYRLERLARDQQEQYLDLDRRMQALRGGEQPSLGGSGAAPGDAASASDPGPRSSGSGGASAGGSGSERDDYAAAFDLMKQRQFDASAAAFEQLVQDYPNGAFTPNAFYWLGELHLAQDDNEAARQSFAQVVNLYPDHQKVPDALYKLGVAYHRLGDDKRAREYLNQVRSRYPQSSAAGLAQSYLAEL